MQTLTFSPIPTAPREGRPTFNVVIAYEDFETGKRAMKTYDYLVQHLGEQCVFNNQMWKFDVMTVPKLREMAVRDALAADVVVVAAHGGSELPVEVRMWMESWIDEAENVIALVGLFDHDTVDHSAREYLERQATNAHVAFFSQPGLWPDCRSAELEINSVPGEQAFSILAGMSHEEPSISHWGINE